MKKSPLMCFTSQEYNSGDGMLTTVWGPCLWFVLHVISFNYPVIPDDNTKKYYKRFLLTLRHVLPCKYCRENLTKNLEILPPTRDKFESRESFSRYIYDLHQVVNKMLNKDFDLSYEEVRDRFEIFRAKCIVEHKNDKISKRSSKRNSRKKINKSRKSKKSKKNKNSKKIKKIKKSKKSKKIKKSIEKGCINPFYGKKSKCVINIIPFDENVNSLIIDKRCRLKKKIEIKK